MVYIVEPDYEIKIGIKGLEVVRVDWREFLSNQPSLVTELVKPMVLSFLKDSIEFLGDNHVEEN